MFNKFKNLFIESEEKVEELQEVKIVTPPPVEVKSLEDVFESNLPESPDLMSFLNATSDSTSPDVYKMAFRMIQTMKPEVTKESLLKDAEEIIKSVESVSLSLRMTGNDKLNELTLSHHSQMEELTKQRDKLLDELGKLEVEIPRINLEYQTESTKITSKISEIDLKGSELKSKYQLIISNIKNFL